MANSTSLMGKADASLVAASYREAMANKPADLKDVYEKNEEAFKTFSEGIDKLYKTITKEEREAAKETRENISNLEDSAEATGIDIFADNESINLKDIRNQLNDPSVTKEDKEKLRKELSRRASKLKGADELFKKVVDKSSEILFEDVESQKLFNLILKDIGDGTNEAKMRYDSYEKDYVFSDYMGNTVTLRQLKDKVGFADIEIAIDVNKAITKIGASKRDLYKNVEAAQDEIYSNLNNKLKNNNAILSAFTDKNFLGMETYSVKDLLENRGKSELSRELYDELKKLDFDGDGEPDATFATPENYKNLVDKINSDSELKKEVISRTVSSISGKHSFEAMERQTAEIPKYLQKGSIERQRYLEEEGLLKTKDRGVEFKLQLPNGNVETAKTTKNNLIYLDKELNNLIASGKSSFDDESYVDMFGFKVGYFPGKGFAPVKIRDDGQLSRTVLKGTKAPKGGYWKTPKDVFKNYGIPTDNSGFYIGQVEKTKDGGKARWNGTNWIKI